MSEDHRSGRNSADCFSGRWIRRRNYGQRHWCGPSEHSCGGRCGCRMASRYPGQSQQQLRSQRQPRAGRRALLDPSIDADIQSVIRRTPFPGIDIIPASPAVAPFDLADQAGWEKAGMHRAFVEAVAPYQDRYDFIVFDCPPRLSLVSFAALVASDFVIVPLEAADWGIKALDTSGKPLITCGQLNPHWNFWATWCRGSRRHARTSRHTWPNRPGSWSTRVWSVLEVVHVPRSYPSIPGPVLPWMFLSDALSCPVCSGQVTRGGCPVGVLRSRASAPALSVLMRTGGCGHRRCHVRPSTAGRGDHAAPPCMDRSGWVGRPVNRHFGTRPGQVACPSPYLP